MEFKSEEFKKRLRQIRRQDLNMNSQDMANFLGYKAGSTILSYECPKSRNMNIKHIIKICSKANVSINWLVYNIGKKYLEPKDKVIEKEKIENIEKDNYTRKKGENNHRWNGGISEYKNHYQLKLNRLEKLKQTEGKCEICHQDGNEIHHKDCDKSNHNISNLVVLCKKHHVMIDKKGIIGRKHKKHKKHIFLTSKYQRMFGKTLAELAKENNCSPTKVLKLFNLKPASQKFLSDKSWQGERLFNSW